jgi:hypothetical protein
MTLFAAGKNSGASASRRPQAPCAIAAQALAKAQSAGELMEVDCDAKDQISDP